MTISQLKGMIAFHTKAEKAYRNAGKIEHADAAKAKREQLEKELAEREQA